MVQFSRVYATTNLNEYGIVYVSCSSYSYRLFSSAIILHMIHAIVCCLNIGWYFFHSFVMPFFIEASPLTWIRHIFQLPHMHRIGLFGMSSSTTELLSTFGKIINKCKLDRKIDDYWLFFCVLPCFMLSTRTGGSDGAADTTFW